MASRHIGRLGSQPRAGSQTPHILSLPSSPLLIRRQFSNSPARAAAPSRVPVKSGLGGAAGRKTIKAGPTPPLPGERKEFKKKVVLANPNARPVIMAEIELPSKAQLAEDPAAAAEKAVKLLRDPATIGTMVKIGAALKDALVDLRAFKPMQGWRFFNTPATLIRPETVELAQKLEQAVEKNETVRELLVGPSGSGKSVLLLQAMMYAQAKGWIVIHFPEGRDLSLNRSAYSQVAKSDPPVYQHLTILRDVLDSLRQRHMNLLRNIPVAEPKKLPDSLKNAVTLNDICSKGTEGAGLEVWNAFRCVMRELTLPNDPAASSTRRPPVMIVVDGLSYLLCETEYLSTEVKPIHALDMVLPRHLVASLSGRPDAVCDFGPEGLKFGNGGAVLAAISGGGVPVTESLKFALERAEAAQSGVPAESLPVWNGYNKPDSRVIDAINPNAVKIRRVEGLGFGHARSLLEYYSQSGLVTIPVKHRLAGTGSAAEEPESSLSSSSGQTGFVAPVKEVSLDASADPEADLNVFTKLQLALTKGLPSELERLVLRVVRR